jgi:hypothetical protein
MPGRDGDDYHIAVSVDSTLGHPFVVNPGSNMVGMLDTTGSMPHTSTVGNAAPTGWVTALVCKAPIALGVDTTPGRAFAR